MPSKLVFPPRLATPHAKSLQGMKRSARSTSDKLRLARSVVKSGVAVKKMHDMAKEMEEHQEQAAEHHEKAMASLEDSLPVFLQTVWDISALDVESTALAVADKLVKDVSVPWQIRIRRAHALRRVGRIFQDASRVGSVAIGDAIVVKQQLEEALHSSISQQRKP
eukprot:TRINITY_DN15401_c0_g1_i3.p1 TRINITY_DN15401_c0_g1~~TRINITY_DN15401_c0_g1_i3.p1  ORF type:complete len:165 (-),score=26.67 TRINITY_DN15401_c0_g1_i3:35-529(-)